MKITILNTMLFLLANVALAQKKVTFAPQWNPQSQFAGYFVAKEKGFYKAEGLDVKSRNRHKGDCGILF